MPEFHRRTARCNHQRGSRAVQSCGNDRTLMSIKAAGIPAPNILLLVAVMLHRYQNGASTDDSLPPLPRVEWCIDHRDGIWCLGDRGGGWEFGWGPQDDAIWQSCAMRWSWELVGSTRPQWAWAF
jgi:hypothetical protein